MVFEQNSSPFGEVTLGIIFGIGYTAAKLLDIVATLIRGSLLRGNILPAVRMRTWLLKIVSSFDQAFYGETFTTASFICNSMGLGNEYQGKNYSN
ncbi:hypothetical protein [Pseudoalteromonas xiamenensis]